MHAGNISNPINVSFLCDSPSFGQPIQIIKGPEKNVRIEFNISKHKGSLSRKEFLHEIKTLSSSKGNITFVRFLQCIASFQKTEKVWVSFTNIDAQSKMN